MADVKAKPILFSGPMIRALLAGTKTQTRRIFKLPSGTHWYESLGGQKAGFLAADLGSGWCHVSELECPFGAVGDLLWVREAFRVIKFPPFQYDEVGESEIDYRATPDNRYAGSDTPWKPSIHMPLAASRLTLRITDVRVERVHEISEEDARSEGADPLLVPPDGGSCPHVEGFRVLWNSIHGPDAWSRNDWVWVIGFDVIRENVEQVVRA